MRQLIIFFFICIYSLTYAQKNDSAYYLDFKIKAEHLSEGGFELLNKRLIQEFILTGKNNNKYLIEIINDSNSVLSQYMNGIWKSIDTINHIFFITDSNELLVPSFYIADFNNDGNQDLLCWTMTNVNGNQWTEIYLNNTLTLIKLVNTADGIWAFPEYHNDKKIITCEEVSGCFGVSSESSFRLKDFKATPIRKVELDNTHMIQKKGKYVNQITRTYIGKNGKWKLVSIKKK
ncbi:MAG: hypothetical protein HXX18_07475 [Bacteroidetes bacterium]|nr:hypothetical protein [Bacteroidota bacterium]